MAPHLTALHLTAPPLAGVVVAALVWLGLTLLARRRRADSALRSLLLRARLSLTATPLLGGLAFWLLERLPQGGRTLPGLLQRRQWLLMVALIWTVARCKGILLGWVAAAPAVAALEGRERLALLDLLDKIVTLLLVTLLVWQLLRLAGVSAEVLLTAGGLGAAALGFGARTIVENGLSGLGLYLNRPFVVGDAIRLPAQQLQGQVEAIGWFYTRLRDPERQTLYVPNGTFTSQAVQNLAQIDRRRVMFELVLRPQDRDRVEAIAAELQRLLAADAAVDPQLPARVNLLGCGETGWRLGVLCHAASGELAEGLALQQRLLLEAGAVVERHGAAIALPSQPTLPSQRTPG